MPSKPSSVASRAHLTQGEAPASPAAKRKALRDEEKQERKALKAAEREARQRQLDARPPVSKLSSTGQVSPRRHRAPRPS